MDALGSVRLVLARLENNWVLGWPTEIDSRSHCALCVALRLASSLSCFFRVALYSVHLEEFCLGSEEKLQSTAKRILGYTDAFVKTAIKDLAYKNM